MATLLPLLVSLCLALRVRLYAPAAGWRHAALVGATIFGVLCVVLTEALSTVAALAPIPLLAAWSLTLVLVLWSCLHSGAVQHAAWRSLWKPSSPLPVTEAMLLAAITAMTAATGLTAWAAAPSNWDSMTYHLPRVMHWLQNGSLAHYPTAIERQLFQPPGSEYVILHLQLLLGSDRGANLVQWASLVGCVIAVSLIARALGADRRGQLLAALACASLPMALLQASSTQNDLALSFWLAALAYFVLHLVRERPSGVTGGWLIGACLGLAVLTKGTAYILAPPLLLWLAWSALKGRRAGQAAALAGVVLIVAGLLNAGHWARNQSVFGTPLGVRQAATDPYSFPNALQSPAVWTSNLLRNTALHIGIERAGPWNRFWEQHLRAVHTVLGVDADDPRTTWTATRFQIEARGRNEDFAGNPLHLLLTGAAFVALLFGRRDPHSRALLSLYLLALASAALLFCVYLKWQPWHGRLHLPLFVLAAPWIGLAWSRARPRAVVSVVAALLVLAALPALLKNELRPLLGSDSVLRSARVEQYFANRPKHRAAYEALAAELRALGCRRLGVALQVDSWEYPLWVLAGPWTDSGAGITHVAEWAVPATRRLDEPMAAIPLCAVLLDAKESPSEHRFAGQTYRRHWSARTLTLYVPAPL